MAPTGIATSLGYIFNGNPSTFNNRLEIRSPSGAGTTFCDPNNNNNNNSTGLPTVLVGAGGFRRRFWPALGC